jgi:hypothetical protein
MWMLLEPTSIAARRIAVDAPAGAAAADVAARRAGDDGEVVLIGARAKV